MEINVRNIRIDYFIKKIYEPWKFKNVSKEMAYDPLNNPTFEFTNLSITSKYYYHNELDFFKEYFCVDDIIHENAYMFIICSLIYLDRLKYKFASTEFDKEIINVYNLHNLLYISIYISTKYLMDKPYTQKDFTKCFFNKGVSLKLILEFELKFLEILNYELYISSEEFEKFIRSYQL